MAGTEGLSFRTGKQWAEDCQKWRGHLLTGVYAHWCSDWDALPVDGHMREWNCCHCFRGQGANRPASLEDQPR
jgi:hypothetical protein